MAAMPGKKQSWWQRLVNRLPGRAEGKALSSASTQLETGRTEWTQEADAEPRLVEEAAVEEAGIPGRWLDVVEPVRKDGAGPGEERTCTAWVNEEPEGGQVMEVRGRQKGHAYRPGRPSPPHRPAAYAHSPPDQNLDSYNRGRADAFNRDAHLRFAQLLRLRVSRRLEFFCLHHPVLCCREWPLRTAAVSRDASSITLTDSKAKDASPSHQSSKPH